jgi:hypothetical protein
MKENIKRAARLLREAARELERTSSIKRAQEMSPGLTRFDVIIILIGEGDVIIPLDKESEFEWMEVIDPDKVWKGENIELKGIYYWHGWKFPAIAEIEIYGTPEYLMKLLEEISEQETVGFERIHKEIEWDVADCYIESPKPGGGIIFPGELEDWEADGEIEKIEEIAIGKSKKATKSAILRRRNFLRRK